MKREHRITPAYNGWRDLPARIVVLPSARLREGVTIGEVVDLGSVGLKQTYGLEREDAIRAWHQAFGFSQGWQVGLNEAGFRPTLEELQAERDRTHSRDQATPGAAGNP